MAHTCSITTEQETLIWDVERLWLAARDLPLQERSVESLIPDLQHSSWWDSERPSAWEGVLHAKRILDADLKYPIILATTGWLMDGAHRVAKAWVMDHKTIKVVQFEEMPEPDERIVRTHLAEGPTGGAS